MSDEVETLQCQVRFLENENRALKQTLRDEFAKAALPEVIHRSPFSRSDMDPEASMRAMTIVAYQIADAMLEARKA